LPDKNHGAATDYRNKEVSATVQRNLRRCAFCALLPLLFGCVLFGSQDFHFLLRRNVDHANIVKWRKDIEYGSSRWENDTYSYIYVDITLKALWVMLADLPMAVNQ